MTGIVIGISLALVILILTSTNVIVGVLATFVIALITCTVLGIVNMIGWKLGPLVSLNLTLIVGLAVDYVVHLAEGYIQSHHSTRSEKVRYALSHVGVSVLSGACSTLGASIFMLAAKVLFFVQFGIFIFATIGFSILYSIFLFPTVMAMIGPEGETGSLLPIARQIKNVFRGKTKDHLDCNVCDGKGYYEKGKFGEMTLRETNGI
jgi:multidrug efflux pump subunit AcrB